MSWYVFWILDLSPKEASGDSEDKIQEENTNDSWRLDEDDTGSCCGNSNGKGSYSSDDDDDNKTTEVCWFISKEVMQHKGEVINNKSSMAEETEVDADTEVNADTEARQRRLREESKEFWDACIAHGY